MSARPRSAARDRPFMAIPLLPLGCIPTLYMAEFIGTALLVLLGVSVVILMFGQEQPRVED